jgi:hypothetical protein
MTTQPVVHAAANLNAEAANDTFEGKKLKKRKIDAHLFPDKEGSTTTQAMRASSISNDQYYAQNQPRQSSYTFTDAFFRQVPEPNPDIQPAFVNVVSRQESTATSPGKSRYSLAEAILNSNFQTKETIPGDFSRALKCSEQSSKTSVDVRIPPSPYPLQDSTSSVQEIHTGDYPREETDSQLEVQTSHVFTDSFLHSNSMLLEDSLQDSPLPQPRSASSGNWSSISNFSSIFNSPFPDLNLDLDHLHRL